MAGNYPGTGIEIVSVLRGRRFCVNGSGFGVFLLISSCFPPPPSGAGAVVWVMVTIYCGEEIELSGTAHAEFNCAGEASTITPKHWSAIRALAGHLAAKTAIAS